MTRVETLETALRRAAQFLKDWDTGDPSDLTGWYYSEFLDEWIAIQKALDPGWRPPSS